jgi:DNA-binding NtrC family response regulator
VDHSHTDHERCSSTFWENISPKSNEIQDVLRYAKSISKTSRPLVITGETGTGKSKMAEYVHSLSGRKGLFIKINALDLEDSLFSKHVSFSKKHHDLQEHHNCLLQPWEGATIFLDEVGDLTPLSQTILFSILDQEFFQYGDLIRKKPDFRFITSTSKDLLMMVEQGAFRKDLFYHLKCHHIDIPSLRKITVDIPSLFKHFLALAAQELGAHVPRYQTSILKPLMDYDFPGNIMELENMTFNILAQLDNKKELKENDLSHSLQGISTCKMIENSSHECFSDQFKDGEDLPTIESCVDLLIDKTLKKNNSNQTASAKSLGITRQGLIARIKRNKVNPAK